MLWNQEGEACNKNLTSNVVCLNHVSHIKSTILQLYSKRPMYTNNIAFFNISFTLSFHTNYATYKHIYFRSDGKIYLLPIFSTLNTS